jgi:hypothetical protein
VICKVLEEDNAYHLMHLVHHSPDGFEYGYGGSGPSDLARSIVGDFLHTREPDPRIYQEFKWAFVANQRGPEFMITEDEIDTWMSDNQLYQIMQG